MTYLSFLLDSLCPDTGELMALHCKSKLFVLPHQLRSLLTTCEYFDKITEFSKGKGCARMASSTGGSWKKAALFKLSESWGLTRNKRHSQHLFFAYCETLISVNKSSEKAVPPVVSHSTKLGLQLSLQYL